MTPNRPLRENLVVDGGTGDIKSLDGFWEKHWLDRLASIGIAAHEGRLFGCRCVLLRVLLQPSRRPTVRDQ